MLSLPFNPFTWDVTSKGVNSDVLTLDLKDDGRRLIEASNLSSGILITIPLRSLKDFPETPHFFTTADGFRYHVIVVVYENTLIQVYLRPNDETVNLLFYLRYNHRPTSEVYDFNGTVSRNAKCVWRPTAHDKIRETEKECTSVDDAPIQMLVNQRGRYFLSVQSSNNTLKDPTRKRRSCSVNGRQKRSCVEVKDSPPTPDRSRNETVIPDYNPINDKNYTMRVALGSCVYWSVKRNMWTADGCEVRKIRR